MLQAKFWNVWRFQLLLPLDRGHPITSQAATYGNPSMVTTFLGRQLHYSISVKRAFKLLASYLSIMLYVFYAVPCILLILSVWKLCFGGCCLFRLSSASFFHFLFSVKLVSSFFEDLENCLIGKLWGEGRYWAVSVPQALNLTHIFVNLQTFTSS